MEAEDEEEMEELSFVSSAVNEPRWALHKCDNKCREKGFKFFQTAAIVTEEGCAAHTINLCKHFYNGRRWKQGEEDVTASKWRELVEQKAFFEGSDGQLLAWNNSCAQCGNVSPSKKAWARSILAGAENVRQHGTDGRWQHETPYKGGARAFAAQH